MRKLFIGTKNFGERNIRDFCYVLVEETNQVWFMNLETDSWSLMANRTIEDIKKQFDKWISLGTIPDKVRVGDILKVNHQIIAVL